MAPVFFGLGAVFTLLGGGIMLNARRFRRRGLRVQGQVVRLRIRRLNRSTMFYPTVRFTTAYGQQVEAESWFGSNPPPGRPGEWVPVVYDPARPARMRIDRARIDGTLHGGIFLTVGVVAVALGVGEVLTYVP